MSEKIPESSYARCHWELAFIKDLISSPHYSSQGVCSYLKDRGMGGSFPGWPQAHRGLAGLLEPWGGLKAEPGVKSSFLTPQLNRDSSLPLQALLVEAGDFAVQVVLRAY